VCAAAASVRRHWLQAWRLLRAAGYEPIGGDHYQRGDLPNPHGRAMASAIAILPACHAA
jgi:hypothetical protein